jgi:hypothetical protein
MSCGLSLAIALAGCTGPEASSSSDPALGVTHDPNSTTPRSEAEPRTPRVVTSAEYTSEPWMYRSSSGAHDGLEITTSNYKIFTTKTTDSLVDRLPLFYEAALANYTSALANLPYPDDRLRTYLFENRNQWMDKTREILPQQADAFRNLGRGGFTTRGTAVLYYIDIWRSRNHDTLAIAAHEGWHQYTQKTFKNTLPVWMEEGIAAYMEGFETNRGLTIFTPADNWERRSALRDAVRKARRYPERESLIPLQTIITKTPQAFLASGKSNLLTYYAQAWGLIHFLAEAQDGKYRDGLEQVLLDAAHGEMVPRLRKASGRTWRSTMTQAQVGTLVIAEYFNPDFDEFEREYLAYLNELTRNRRRSD